MNLTPIAGRKRKPKSCSSWLGFCNEQLQLCSHLHLSLFDCLEWSNLMMLFFFFSSPSPKKKIERKKKEKEGKSPLWSQDCCLLEFPGCVSLWITDHTLFSQTICTSSLGEFNPSQLSSYSMNLSMEKTCYFRQLKIWPILKDSFTMPFTFV